MFKNSSLFSNKSVEVVIIVKHKLYPGDPND